MKPGILPYIEDAYPTKRLDAVSEAVLERYRNMKESLAILQDIQEVSSIECEKWHPDDELERSLQLLVVTPSLAYWSGRFHSQPAAQRVQVLKENGGTYCNMTVYISNVSPFYMRSWTCWVLQADSTIHASGMPSAPTAFWLDVQHAADAIFAQHGRILMTHDEAVTEVPWILPGSDLEERHVPVTVFRCLFEER